MGGESSIATFPTRDDAEIARGLLESVGIEARVVSDDAGGAFPLPLSGGVQLVVDESDRDAAAAVLAGGADNG